MKHRSTMKDLLAKREHYVRMGLEESVKGIDLKIQHMKDAGERLKAYRAAKERARDDK